MAINPELITTIRVDQLPDETLSLTNLFPHTVGTELKSATIQELVDLVATSIGVSGGVGYIAISVTDGQQLPDVPELPSFFLCGAGTFLNINGFPNIICTENLNAIMSLTDHWELAVEIPINPLSGSVQSVTGSAVDNTDPLNPVINEIIYGVQNIIAGTNITVDNTDPANPIISATGGGGTQTLAEVLVEGNITDGNDISISDGDKIVLDNGANLKKGTTDAGLGGTKGIALRCAVDYELKWEAGRLYVMGGDGFTIREVSHNFTTLPTVTDDDDKGFTIDSRWILDNGDVYVCTDATTGAAVWQLYSVGATPTLQQVTESGNETTLNIKVKDSEKSSTLQQNGLNFVDIDQGGSTTLRFEHTDVVDQEVLIRGLGGTMALLSDITGATPTLQEVLTDGGDEAVDSKIILSNTANDFETSINEFGDGGIYLKSIVNDTSIIIGASVVFIGDSEGVTGTYINKDKITVNAIQYPFPTGTSSPIATLADITGGGGVPYTGATQDLDLGEFGLKAGQVTLDTTPTGTAVVATTRWNDTLGSSETLLKGGSVILKNGVDLVARVVNKVSPNTTLTKAAYQVVKVSGAQGQRLAIDLARANNDLNSADTLGVVTETIDPNQEGFILTVGQLEGINTTGSLQGETWADGDVLYLSPTTAGRITNIKPNGSTGHIVIIGYVEYAHANNGKIYVKIMNGWELDELHNVFIDTPNNNQALTYETSTDLWKNKTIIEDAIVNGVTTIAPSQNAVFDALALKQAVLSYTPYKNIQTSQTVLTGTTSETNIFTATIPAGAFNSTDIIRVLFGANKTTALGTYTLRLRINTTNTIVGAPTIATYSGTTTAQVNIMQRNFNLNGGNLYGFSFTSSTLTDIIASGQTLTSTTLNPANQFFIFATIQLANASDSIIGNMLSISN
jgi:nitrogen fixation protein